MSKEGREVITHEPYFNIQKGKIQLINQ